MSEQSTRIPPELEEVANQVGEFIQYWGFKKVHGRIWTQLFLAQTPLDAAELMERVDISKALVSMSISDLLEYDVVEIAGKSPRATITYRVNPQIISVITNILRKRERRMLGRIGSAVKVLKKWTEEAPSKSHDEIKLAPERVKLLSEMVSTAEMTLDGMLQLTDVSFSPWGQFEKIPAMPKVPKPI